jgi:hypothetical protein
MQGIAAGAPVLKYLPTLAAVLLVAVSLVSSPRPAATGPVADALKSASSADRAKVASIYRALGDLMRRDSGRLISTTALWRSVYTDALRLAAGGTDLVGKYPGLDAAVEETLGKYYSLQVLPIDDALTEKIVAACKDVERQSE